MKLKDLTGLSQNYQMCSNRRQILERSLATILINVSHNSTYNNWHISCTNAILSLLIYRTTPHTTTGIYPAQVLFYHMPSNGLPTIQPSKSSTVNNRETHYREQNKEYRDKKRFTQHKDFQVGEKVLVKQ